MKLLHSFIKNAKFDLGLEKWSQCLNQHPKSLQHVLNSSIKTKMDKKWVEQSKENRDRLYRDKDKVKNWDRQDIRKQTQGQALDYLRRVQGYDVVFGVPLTEIVDKFGNFSQDRYGAREHVDFYNFILGLQMMECMMK
jgi:hypothetical protein